MRMMCHEMLHTTSYLQAEYSVLWIYRQYDASQAHATYQNLYSQAALRPHDGVRLHESIHIRDALRLHLQPHSGQ